jgi:hypothetical protein
MKTAFFIFLLLASCFTTMPLIAQDGEGDDLPLLAPDDNSITIDIMTKGTYKVWEYTLNPTSITATKHSTEGRLPITVFEKILTSEESAEVRDFINNFPAGSLKEQYVNNKAEGEGSYEFHFRINAIRKKVIVSYEYPDELKKVVDIFNKYLHVKYQISFE